MIPSVAVAVGMYIIIRVVAILALWKRQRELNRPESFPALAIQSA
jgi:hypothetical protein